MMYFAWYFVLKSKIMMFLVRCLLYQSELQSFVVKYLSLIGIFYIVKKEKRNYRKNPRWRMLPLYFFLVPQAEKTQGKSAPRMYTCTQQTTMSRTMGILRKGFFYEGLDVVLGYQVLQLSTELLFFRSGN